MQFTDARSIVRWYVKDAKTCVWGLTASQVTAVEAAF